jgi:glycosyltransferase involved in cell wall biosynthesis
MNSITAFLKTKISEKKRHAIRCSGLYRFVKKNIDGFLLKQWISLKKKNSRKPFFSQKLGVNLIGFLNAELGLGSAARGSVLALDSAQVPVNLINIELPGSIELETSLPGLQQPAGMDYGINLIHTNPPEYLLLWKRLDKTLLTRGYNIGVWFWELPDLPDEWKKNFPILDEVWVATRFIQETVQKSSSIPVIKIPPCIHVDLDPTLQRSDFNLPNGAFLFLNAYDTHSISERKNPLASIRAFKEAFPAQEASVGFVIKVSNAIDDSNTIDQIKNELLGHPNCHLIEDSYPRTRFNTLINLVDVYVSLHRSEGFGLIPAEAMFLGKPVIATNWSGNTDFMTPENSCCVDFKLVPVKPGLLHYKPGHLWADADVSHAAHWMKKLASDHIYYNKISLNARATISHDFSPEKIGDLMKTRLKEIIG